MLLFSKVSLVLLIIPTFIAISTPLVATANTVKFGISITKKPVGAVTFSTNENRIHRKPVAISVDGSFVTINALTTKIDVTKTNTPNERTSTDTYISISNSSLIASTM